ncbi:MAG: hypothetical protein QOJ89_3560, partial [bacterium]
MARHAVRAAAARGAFVGGRVAEARRPKLLGAMRRLASGPGGAAVGVGRLAFDAPLEVPGSALGLTDVAAAWMSGGAVPDGLVPLLGSPTLPGLEGSAAAPTATDRAVAAAPAGAGASGADVPAGSPGLQTLSRTPAVARPARGEIIESADLAWRPPPELVEPLAPPSGAGAGAGAAPAGASAVLARAGAPDPVGPRPATADRVDVRADRAPKTPGPGGASAGLGATHIPRPPAPEGAGAAPGASEDAAPARSQADP